MIPSNIRSPWFYSRRITIFITSRSFTIYSIYKPPLSTIVSVDMCWNPTHTTTSHLSRWLEHLGTPSSSLEGKPHGKPMIQRWLWEVLKIQSLQNTVAGWWLNQPSWKIWSSKWESSPTRGENKKCLSSRALCYLLSRFAAGTLALL